jgi:hypothetical protein
MATIAVDCRVVLSRVSFQAGSHPGRPGRPVHSRNPRNPRNPAPECCSAWDLDADRRSNLLLLLNMTGSKRPACSHCNALLLFTFYVAPAIRSYAGSHIVQLRAAQLGVRQKTTQWTASMRKRRSFDHAANRPNGPRSHPSFIALHLHNRSNQMNAGCVTPEARRERDPEDCGDSGFGYRRL